MCSGDLYLQIEHGFEHVQVIWQNWAKNWPNMGVAVPRAPVGTRSPEPLKSSVTGPSLLVNCYIEIKFHKKIRVTHLNKHAMRITDVFYSYENYSYGI